MFKMKEACSQKSMLAHSAELRLSPINSLVTNTYPYLKDVFLVTYNFEILTEILWNVELDKYTHLIKIGTGSL